MKTHYQIGCTGLFTDIPLMVAHAKGFFDAEDVPVVLAVELGWASLELKLASDQLVAANVPPSFPLLLSLKKNGIAPMHALTVTSFHGEAITLNRDMAAIFLSGKMNTLKSIRIGLDAPYTLSQVFVQSWMKTSRIDRHPAIQLVPLAISQLLDLLKDGYIHGFCCAEPVGQIAVETGIGVTVARSREHPSVHIQSVLAATDEFCSAHPETAKAITLAVDRARLYCANPKNETEVLRIYRKQTGHKLTLTDQSAGESTAVLPLPTFIGFEAAAVNGHAAKDPFGALASACTTLPGVTAAEREIREAVKRMFSRLH